MNGGQIGFEVALKFYSRDHLITIANIHRQIIGDEVGIEVAPECFGICLDFASSNRCVDCSNSDDSANCLLPQCLRESPLLSIFEGHISNNGSSNHSYTLE